MATKLTKDQLGILESLGFEGNTDELVRPQIIEKLKEYDVSEVDDDPIEDLIGIVQAFMEIEEPENKKKSKSTKAAKVEEDEEEDEDTGAEEEDEEESEDDEEIIDDEESEDETEDEEEEEEEEEAPKPAKKSAPVVAPVVAKKAVAAPVTKTKEVAKPVVKKEVKTSKPEVKTARVVYNGDEADHVKALKKVFEPQFKKFGLEGSYNKSCIAVSLEESDSKRSVICIESIIFKDEDFTFKVVFNGMNLFKNSNNLHDMMEEVLDDDFLKTDRLVVNPNNSYPFVKSITTDEVEKIFTPEIIQPMLDKIGTFDKKLRKNREKMEEEYENAQKTPEPVAKAKDKVKAKK